MSELPQRDLFEAKAARDAALARVAGNGKIWMAMALDAVDALRGFSGTGEDLRFDLMEGGLEPPHHHNVWGSLVRVAIGRRLLIPTGEFRHMTGSKSHARKSEVYRSLL